MSRNEPVAHHYVPEFYLKRWTGADGRLWRFSKPYGPQVKAKKVAPSGTAFEPNLYKAHSAPPEHAQKMETEFLKKLDTDASEALLQLEEGLQEEKWNSRHRSSWSRFLLTQMLRAPEDIAQLKSSVTEDWSKAIPELVEAYATQKSEDAPQTVDEFIKSIVAKNQDEFAFRIARTLMDHPQFGQALNEMHWHVIDIPHDAYPLLTSDRPVWMTPTIVEPDAFLTIPIGPRKLFTATVAAETQARLKMRRRSDLVKAVNRITVQHAVKYVYGDTDTMSAFIQKHMSTRRHSTLLERLAAMRGHRLEAPDAPLKSR